MDCKGYQENLAAYLDGQLMAPEARAVEAHREACKPCAQFYQELRDLDGIFSDPAAVLEPPARMWDRIQTAIRSSQDRQPAAGVPDVAFWRQAFKRLSAWATVDGRRVRYAAAGAVVAVVISLFLGTHYYSSYKTERQMLAQIDKVQQVYLRGIDQNPFGESVRMEKLDDNPFETITLENEKNPFKVIP